MPISWRNSSICSLRHQPGVVVLVAGERQAHALDGVGDETGRLVALGIGGAQRLDDRFDVMAAQIGHQGAQFLISQLVDDRPRLRPSQIGQQGLPPGGAALEGQRRYRLFGQSSIQARSASPPSRANAASSLRPYLMVTQFQPMSRNSPSIRPNSRSGTTESRLWRL